MTCIGLLLPHLQTPPAAAVAQRTAGQPTADVVAELGLGSVSYRLDVALGPDAVSEVRPPLYFLRRDHSPGALLGLLNGTLFRLLSVSPPAGGCRQHGAL